MIPAFGYKHINCLSIPVGELRGSLIRIKIPVSPVRCHYFCRVNPLDFFHQLHHTFGRPAEITSRTPIDCRPGAPYRIWGIHSIQKYSVKSAVVYQFFHLVKHEFLPCRVPGVYISSTVILILVNASVSVFPISTIEIPFILDPSSLLIKVPGHIPIIPPSQPGSPGRIVRSYVEILVLLVTVIICAVRGRSSFNIDIITFLLKFHGLGPCTGPEGPEYPCGNNPSSMPL